MIQFVLMDIEGTTSSIDFVHQVLFPYSLERMEAYLQAHQNEEAVQKAILDFQNNLPEGPQKLSLNEVIKRAQKMIQDDVKYGPLKTIQGFIWQEGYIKGDIKGHVYGEVPQSLKKWSDQGLKLGIYSSGSVLAQKLIFGYTAFGDLTQNLSAFFDTAVGAKKESASYEKIAQQLSIKPEHILFLSDRTEELDAAHKAKMQTVLVQRDQPKNPTLAYTQVSNFDELQLS